MATEPLAKTNAERNWFILSSLVSKDFKLKYRRSALGIVWSVLNPLLMMLVLSAVFSYIFRFEIEHFPLYLILGTILFNYMSATTSSAMTSIIDASSLIKKIKIEKLVFPIEKALFEILNFVISLVAVAIVMVVLQVMPTATAFMLPLLLIYVFMFSAGLGMLLSALAVFFRDVIHIWSVAIIAWTYATPLFYPVSLLNDTMRAILEFNPMYHYVTYFRDIMMYNTVPSLMENLICFGMAAITLVVGLLVFRKFENKFVLFV